MTAIDPDKIQPERVPWGTRKVLIDSNSVGSKNFVVSLTEMEPGQSHETHQDDADEALFVLSGRGIHEREHARVEIGPNQAVFVPAGVRHSTSCLGKEPLRVIVVKSLPKETHDRT